MKKLFAPGLFVLLALLLSACIQNVAPIKVVTPTPEASAPASTATSAPFSTVTSATDEPTAVASASPTAPPATPAIVKTHLDKEFVLHPRETAILTDTPDQFGITFYDVTQDSRCPQGVTCVWAGEVRLRITFQENGILHPPVLEMTTTPNDPNNTREIEGYRVQLLGVQPPAVAGTPIPPEAYAATFRVTRAEAQATPTDGSVTTANVLEPFDAKFLQPVEIPGIGMRVIMNGVLEDSRCPSSVNCAVAGRALVSFRLERDGQLGMFTLSTQPPDGRTFAYFQGFALELLKLSPYPETPGQEIPSTAYVAHVVVRPAPRVIEIKKNQGFPLKLGESATLQDENVTVKFVSVDQDSRCPAEVDCFVRGNAIVKAILTEADGTTTTFILNDDPSKTNQRIPDQGPYGMELVALTPYPRADSASNAIKPEDYEATFVVRKFASSGPRPTATTVAVAPTGCLDLSAGDAQAILGEPVSPERYADVLIQVPLDDSSEKNGVGVCGYAGASKNPSAQRVPNEPYEVAHVSNTALGAQRLTGARVLELLRVGNIIRGANPNADSTPYLIFQTRLVAGDWDGLFENIQQLAGDSKDVHFEAVDSFGDQGLWVWREAQLHNYAALLVRDGADFVILEALLNKAVTEAGAKESLHAALGDAMK